MDEKGPTFNSPLITKNTPIKRLGLSRKRKSWSSPTNQKTKTQEIKLDIEKKIKMANEDQKSVNSEVMNYEKELETLKKRINEKEEKLKALQINKNKIQNLERLIELWKSGCKNAFLHLSCSLKKRQSEFNCKAILTSLGVWDTMVKNFENDSDIPLSDESQ